MFSYMAYLGLVYDRQPGPVLDQEFVRVGRIKGQLMDDTGLLQPGLMETLLVDGPAPRRVLVFGDVILCDLKDEVEVDH